MPKPLFLLIYQDCYDCEHNKAWHEQVKSDAAEYGVLIKYTPHNTPGVKQIILEAHEKGVEVPFLSDGKKHSRKLEDLVEVATPQKKHQKKEVKDGAVPAAK